MKRFVAFVGRYNGAPRKLLRRKKRNLGFYKLNGNFAIQSFGKIRISIFRPPTANLRVGGQKSPFFFDGFRRIQSCPFKIQWFLPKKFRIFFGKEAIEVLSVYADVTDGHVSLLTFLQAYSFLSNFWQIFMQHSELSGFYSLFFFHFKLSSLLFPLRNLKFPVSKLLSMWSEQNFRCQRGPSSYIIIFFV